MGRCLAQAGSDLYIKYITASFLIFFSCVCHKKTKKCLRFPRLVSSPASSAFLGPLAALVSLFFYDIPNSDLRFFSCAFFFWRGYEFLLSSEPQIGFNMKKERRNPSTNFVCLCLCTEFSIFCFLVTAAFMIIEPSHTHTHTQLSHSIYLFLKTLDVYLSLI